MNQLKQKKCAPCEGGAEPLSQEQSDDLLAELDGWTRRNEEITKTFHFRNYYQTMAFVNASAYVSHQEDHHPNLLIGYKTCRAAYTTHAIGGLSENDFICAAKLDDLTAS